MSIKIKFDKHQERIEDVEVYKVFHLKEKGLCSNSHWNYCKPDGDGMVKSDPSTEYVWEKGVLPQPVRIMTKIPHEEEGIGMTTEGYYAYSRKKTADEYAKKWGDHLVVRKCVIPAGVGFWFSTDGKSIVCEQLMVVE